MGAGTRAVQLAGRSFHCPCHACAFFHNQEEEYRILLPFMAAGIAAGDRSFQILDRAHRAERRRRLAEVGIDTEATERPGQLELRAWEEAYLRGGRFDQHAMLALIDEVLSGGRRQGFNLTRLWADMEWGLEEFPGVQDIVEYESRLNRIVPKHQDVVVCSYDLSRFSAAVVMDILRVHPQVIIGGIMQENPFYVPPEEFLEELRHREAQTD